jgi:biopolymer transport protein ExbD
MKLNNSVGPPQINVTPLIDVLLVLLIIFMVITPLRPSRFKASIPHQSTAQQLDPPVQIEPLVVNIDKDFHLTLNKLSNLGTVNDPTSLEAELLKEFNRRAKNYTNQTKIERAVFIKAPRSIGYGEVTKVIDIVKGVGADPIGLQSD